MQTFLFLWFSLSLPPFAMHFVSVFLQKPTLVWWPLPKRRVDVRGCFNDVLALLPEIRWCHITTLRQVIWKLLRRIDHWVTFNCAFSLSHLSVTGRSWSSRRNGTYWWSWNTGLYSFYIPQNSCPENRPKTKTFPNLIFSANEKQIHGNVLSIGRRRNVVNSTPFFLSFLEISLKWNLCSTISFPFPR